MTNQADVSAATPPAAGMVVVTKVTCPGCGRPDRALTKTGKISFHNTVSGERCEASGVRPEDVPPLPFGGVPGAEGCDRPPRDITVVGIVWTQDDCRKMGGAPIGLTLAWEKYAAQPQSATDDTQEADRGA